MRVWPGMFLVATLGCLDQSPQSLVYGPEATSLSTTRSVDDTLRFISNEWSKYTASISTIPVQDGYLISVIYQSGSLISALVHRSPEDGLTHIRFGRVSYMGDSSPYLVPFRTLQVEYAGRLVK